MLIEICCLCILVQINCVSCHFIWTVQLKGIKTGLGIDAHRLNFRNRFQMMGDSEFESHKGVVGTEMFRLPFGFMEPSHNYTA